MTLTEAYAYASERTVASTAATLAGLQHPTYNFDIKGRADVVLTRPKSTAVRLGFLQLTRPGLTIVRKGNPAGPVTAEVFVEKGAPMAMRLPLGSYFLQRRTSRAYFESQLALDSIQAVNAGTVPETRTAYAAFARKGGGRDAYSGWLAAGVSNAPAQGFGSPLGVQLSASRDGASVSWDAWMAVDQSTNTGPGLPSLRRRLRLAVWAALGL